MMPRVPEHYNKGQDKARNRDIVLRWAEGQGVDLVAKLYEIEPGEVARILDLPDSKKLREELRQRAIEHTLERFDVASAKSLEHLIRLRDESEDEKMQRLAALDILEYSSLTKAKESEGNLGAELIRGIARMAHEAAELVASKEKLEEKK